MKEIIVNCRRGYIYTILTITLILISLSLIGFYLQFSRTKVEDSAKRMAMEKLHYFVDNIKNDYSNALEISGRRASTYAINFVLNSSIANFSNYVMNNCTSFNYTGNGSKAAIIELMLCGTLFREKVQEIENNTLLNWTQKIKEIKGADVKILDIKNVTLILQDSWNFAAISILEISTTDKGNLSSFNGNVSVFASISIFGLEDALYKKTNESNLIRKFLKCNDSAKIVNGTTINEWVNSKCYHESNSTYKGPSFFDRLDGNLNLTVGDEGLESFVNVYDLFLHNVSVNLDENYTWVDYLFWQNVKGDCTVNHTDTYWINSTKNITFWIDLAHKEKYNISGANCR